MHGIVTEPINTWKMRKTKQYGTDLKQLRSYYDDLFAEFLPEKLSW